MIQVKIRLFAALRDAVGTDTLELEVRRNGSCKEIFASLEKEYGHVSPILQRSLVAVNGFYSGPNASLSPGDEVAILPPVSGG
jgi:molybdopterin synthase catalytic subunit/molybdopterin synthase sulfur carrier subunit